MNTALTFLCNRHSYPRLTQPAPDVEQLKQMFQAALAAPDHGQLQPYRFRVFDADRLNRLGDIFVRALQEEGEQNEKVLEKVRSLPQRAPMVIVAICHHQPDHPKAPAQEQLITAGLATLQLINAAEALGFGGYWRTGDLAYKPSLSRALQLAEHESVIGFIYVGTPEGEPKASKKHLSAEEIWQWG